MQIDSTTRDYREHLDGLKDAIKSKDVSIYLDANILLWLVRVAPTARAEFITWSKSIKNGKVKIPVWAAHEFHHHIAQKSAIGDIQSQLNEVKKGLENLHDLVVERADNSTCARGGFANRESVVNQVAASVTKFDRIIKVLRLDEGSFYTATNEVIDFINERTLESNVDEIGRSLFDRGDFRYGHRIPPGFQDRAKDENRFGDLIIWEEILLDLASINKPKVKSNAIIVSRDEKNDWVTSGLKLIDESGNLTTPDRKIALDVSKPHPMLLHELETRVERVDLRIVHTRFLAAALHWTQTQDKSDKSISNWLAVSYLPDYLSRLEGREESKGQESQVDTLIEEEGSLRESLKAVANTPPLDEFNSFLEMDPQQQDEAIAGITDFLNDPESAFGLGKSIGMLSADSITLRERVFEILESVYAAKGASTANRTLLAVLVNIYFESEMLPRRFPQMELGITLLLLEEDDRFDQAFTNLHQFLKNSEVNLPYLPGLTDQKVSVELKTQKSPSGRPQTIQDLRVCDTPVLIDGEGGTGNRTLSNLLEKTPEEFCSKNDLKMLLAQEFLIPESKIVGLDGDKKNLTWKKDAIVSYLDTEADNGIGFPDSEEEDHG